ETRRDMLLEILERRHFVCYKPYGAYYIMTDIGGFGFRNDVEFARYLVKDVGVAAVPGSSFYKTPSKGRTKLRFCFGKQNGTLKEADRRLEKLAPAGVRLPCPHSLATTPIYSPFSVKHPAVPAAGSAGHCGESPEVFTANPRSSER